MAYQLPDHFRYASYTSLRRGFTCEDLDEGRGYLFRISRGSRSVILGAGRASPYPINTSSAYTISKDKSFTNRLLSEAGVANLGGQCFFLTQEHRSLRAEGYETEDARAYAVALGFPIFCKPLLGSRGDFAERVDSLEHLDDYFERVARKYDSIIIQPFFRGTEFRVLVLDRRVVFALRKHDVTLIGDGIRTVREHLSALNEPLKGTGISPLPEGHSIATNSGRYLMPTDILAAHEVVTLAARRNFSAHRGVGHLISPCPHDLESLALKATAAVGLRLAGVDILREFDSSAARVIEVNGKPAIRSLEELGRWDLIEEIWGTVIESALDAAQ